MTDDIDSDAGDITAAHYFVGIIGFSMLRNWYGDAVFNRVRMTDLTDLLANLDQFPHSLVLNLLEHALIDGYAEWTSSYDGPNPLIGAEEPAVQPVFERLAGPGVRSLDAACGTGRHAAFLAERGCVVTGIDQSEAMLAVAKGKLPDARFVVGSVEAMPFDDGEFDVAVISLALCHLADPTLAVTEFGRVLRPGGTLVITDPHPMSGLTGGQAFYGGIVPGQPMRWVRNHWHSAATWLRAFRSAGLSVEDCHELAFTEAQIASSPASFVYRDAADSAVDGLASLWLWVVTRDA